MGGVGNGVGVRVDVRWGVRLVGGGVRVDVNKELKFLGKFKKKNWGGGGGGGMGRVWGVGSGWM